MLLERVTTILDEAGFLYAASVGCCDIVAKKDELFLFKVLSNVDSFQREQSESLHALSYHLHATPLLIGEHTRTERLGDDIVYDRFSIPTITAATFEHVVSSRALPHLCRHRGGLHSHVNAEKLRHARESFGITQQELAQRIGTTKKSIYEHEKQSMRMEQQFVDRLEQLFSSILTDPVEFYTSKPTTAPKPETRFKRRITQKLVSIGFETTFLHKSPFNLITREANDFVILSSAFEDDKRTEKHVPFLRNFSLVTKKPTIVITQHEATFEIPTIREKELSEFASKRELKRFIKTWYA